VVTPNVAARPARIRAWRVAVVLVLAALAGAAILLQIRGWSAVEGESGSACASGSDVCPHGVVPVLVISFVVGLVTIPFVIAAVVRRPKVNAVVAAVGLVIGVFAAQALSGGLHAAGLRVDWTAPYDAAGSPATEGVWTAGSSLIRVRADQVVSYQAATGRQQWTLAVPGGDVVCAVSAGTSSATVGLIGYGTAGACDQVLAVDLGTGQQLWSKRVPASWKGEQGTGFTAIGGDTAVAVTAGAALGYDQRTGAPRWTALTPPGCSDQTLAGARQSVVVLAACGKSFDVIALAPATGKQLWRTPVAGQSPGYHFAILSADPVVVTDVAAPGQPEQALAFGATGHLTARIPVGGLDTSYYQGFGPQVAVSGGLLVGLTRSSGHSDVVAYRLSDGGRQWLVSMPDHVLSLRQDGGQLLVIDQSRPSLALDAISLPNGSLYTIGYVLASIVDPSGATVYSAGDRYVVVNLSGRAPVPPAAAVG